MEEAELSGQDQSDGVTEERNLNIQVEALCTIVLQKEWSDCSIVYHHTLEI